MKSKKILCLVLVLVLALACSATLLAACDPSSSGGGDKVIIIWGPAEHKDIYLEYAKKFQDEHLDMLEGYTFSYAGNGDAVAYSSMNADPTTGAAIYTFANDQAANLRNLGALATTTGDNLAWSRANNSAAAVEATKLGDGYYGYPLQADNGYYMYYNKAAFRGTSVWDDENDCLKAGYTFRDLYAALDEQTATSTYKDSNGNDVVIDWSKSVVTWPMGDSWYMSGIFFSVGGDYEVVYDSKGKQVSADCWFACPGSNDPDFSYTDYDKVDYTVGMYAYQCAKNSFTNPDGSVNKHYAYTDGSTNASNDYIANHSNVDNSSAREVPLAAGVCGTWKAKELQAAWGEDYAATVLPVLENDAGMRFQMKNFAGYKNLGVNPLCSFISGAPQDQKAARLALLHEFAQYLCGKEISLARHDSTGAGPANLEALADPSIVSDVALQALNAQYALVCNYPANYKDLNGDSSLAGQPIGNGLGYRNQDSVPANYWTPIQNFGQLLWAEFSVGKLEAFANGRSIRQQLASMQSDIAQAGQ